MHGGGGQQPQGVGGGQKMREDYRLELLSVRESTAKLVDNLPYSHDEVRPLPTISSNPDKSLPSGRELTPETPEPRPEGSMLGKRPDHRTQ